MLFSLLPMDCFLFALLFGDDSTNTRLERVQQELLTIAVPRAKAGALDFMRASTELAAAGTWQDPGNVSNDERADNVLLDMRFDIADASGNTTSFVMEPAFAVGRDSFFGRRIRLDDPQPPTSGASYVANWEEFRAFIDAARHRMADELPPRT